MSIPRHQLSPEYSISKVIKGGWHLAGGHGKIDATKAIDEMKAFVEAGITTFDCADIYTGVEDLIGAFRRKFKDQTASGDLAPIQIHTKYVPDYNALNNLTKEHVTKIIDRSLKRLGVERLDLVQFAWWDYSKGDFVKAATHLAALQTEGKIRHLGVTNFDQEHLQMIKDAGVKVVSNQVQYSVLDRRAEIDFAKDDTPFLCYGTIAGGFLSNRYLYAPDPEQPLENRSLTKYRLIIEEFGSYSTFQDLLQCLDNISTRYDVGIAEVASKYILDRPEVGAVIIGARNTNHLDKFAKIFNVKMSEIDRMKIKQFMDDAQGPKGPFYALERDKTGKHGRIMKYNLNDA